MARVTVEDCLENVKNRFELVMLASKRARQLMRGSSEPKVAWENDKATVVALREIAMGYTDFSDAHHAEPLANIQHQQAMAAAVDMDAEDELEIGVDIEEIDLEIHTEETHEDNDSIGNALESEPTTDNNLSEPDHSAE